MVSSINILNNLIYSIFFKIGLKDRKSNMEKAFRYGQMELFTKGGGTMTKLMALADSSMLTATTTKVIG